MKVKYWLAQYTENPLRREPRNVGVIVENCVSRSARFLGEEHPTDEIKTGIDGRYLRQIQFDKAYRSWVRRWRIQAFKSGDGVSVVESAFNESFRVVQGGSMVADEHDVAELTDYLFHTLVRDDFEKALDAIGKLEERDAEDLKFVEVVDKALDDKGFIVNPDETDLALSRGFVSPIIRGASLEGETIAHKLHMVQKDIRKGDLWVMQMLDFGTRKKASLQRDAGYQVFVANDVKRLNDNVLDIAIINMTQQDKDDYLAVRAGLKVLEKNMHRIVNWSKPEEREAFLEEREEIALGRGAA